MANKNKLSIYLIKDDFAADDFLILKSTNYKSIPIKNVGKVYYEKSFDKAPSWTSFFRGYANMDELYSTNARALLLCRISIDDNIYKLFALTFGYGRNMLKEEVVEEDFGLKVVVNTITAESLRKISKINIGGNQKISQEQMPLESDIDGFQVDVDRDLIGGITGHSDDENFAVGMMTGTDMLSLSAEVNINNLPEFLRKVYSRYISKSYLEQFGWIDNIRRVKRKSIINNLDDSVVNHIKMDHLRFGWRFLK